MDFEVRKLRCPNCKDTNIRYRIRKKNFTCERCGHTFAKPVET